LIISCEELVQLLSHLHIEFEGIIVAYAAVKGQRPLQRPPVANVQTRNPFAQSYVKVPPDQVKPVPELPHPTILSQKYQKHAARHDEQ
jgi:hypothetical protein